MKHKTLIISIALNGYQWFYKKELNSHKQYATRHGYTHQAITRPFVSRLGVECCWLKLTVMRNALISGYERVLFLDADATVKPNCPALSEIIKRDKYVYMAKGYSGRFNSGVILALNNPNTIYWLNNVIKARGRKVHKSNDVGWGENGHVIEYSNGVSFIEELNEKWNNTANYELNDYIRHSNCGPMRVSMIHKFFHKVVFYLCAKHVTYLSNKDATFDNALHEENLTIETNTILSFYPELTYS